MHIQVRTFYSDTYRLERRIRYGELKKSIPNISHKILSQELKNLEMDSLIERIAYVTIPLKVEYIPTDRGKSFENILSELCIWGKKYMNTF